MNGDIATIAVPAPWDTVEAAREARTSTTNVLDAMAFAAAAHAGDHVTKDWEARLYKATQLVRGYASYIIVKEAERHGWDLDNGFTYDDVPPDVAGHVAMYAVTGIIDWLDRLDRMS